MLPKIKQSGHDWRKEYCQFDEDGDEVLDVLYWHGQTVAYQYKTKRGDIYITTDTGILVRKDKS